MALSESQAKANKKYQDKFDDIKVRVPKGQRQVWQDYATAHGESLNAFIRRAVDETMKSEDNE